MKSEAQLEIDDRLGDGTSNANTHSNSGMATDLILTASTYTYGMVRSEFGV
jgi:hypothetical protein